MFQDGCRTAFVALVAVGDELKYILATEKMKAGDIIRTSRVIPRNPGRFFLFKWVDNQSLNFFYLAIIFIVRASEGDAWPLGALPVNTKVHCVEQNPGLPKHMIHAAGTYGTILRKFDDYVVVQLPSKRELAFKNICMATVGKWLMISDLIISSDVLSYIIWKKHFFWYSGRISNIEHGTTHVGSPNRNRELGNRPRSGLWQRKTGRHGRKIKRLPPMRIYPEPKARPERELVLSLPDFKYH